MGNYHLYLRAKLVFLTLSCLEAIDPISVILGGHIILTILKELEIVYGNSIPHGYFHFLVFWHVLVSLSSCSCGSRIARLLKWIQMSRLWVQGILLLYLLVWRRGS